MYEFDFEFTEEQLADILPLNDEIGEWYEALCKTLPVYEITTRERVAGFLAQCAHESSEFRVLEENLRYSESALNRVFGKYFGSRRNAANYAYKPEKIANVVYANRIGNGGTRSGDGWRYRGRGIIQLTGKANYEDFGKDIGATPEQVIEYLQTKTGAVEAACWYWYTRGLNREADQQDLRAMTKRINGGYNGLDHRAELYARAKRVLFTGPAQGRITRVHGLGDYHEEIKLVQEHLGIMVDGKFGPQTKRHVKQFQRENGLAVDGYVGRNTATAMGFEYA